MWFSTSLNSSVLTFLIYVNDLHKSCRVLEPFMAQTWSFLITQTYCFFLIHEGIKKLFQTVNFELKIFVASLKIK